MARKEFQGGKIIHIWKSEKNQSLKTSPATLQKAFNDAFLAITNYCKFLASVHKLC